jgi:hypothetical protein
MRILLVSVGTFVVLVCLGWLGLRIEPSPVPVFPQQTVNLGAIPLPKDLPAAVERFYRQVCGENVPIIESLVVTG